MLNLMRQVGFDRRRTGQLGGGQVRRVAGARELFPESKVFVLDEPLSALELGLRQKMHSNLRCLRQQSGLTFIVVSRNQTEALAMPDWIAVMRDGAIEQYGTPQGIYQRASSLFAFTFIGETNLPAAIFVRTTEFAAVVRCSYTELPVPSRWALTGIAPRQQMAVAIRAGGVRVWPGSLGAADGTSPWLAEMTYLGRYMRLRLVRGGGSALWVGVSVVVADQLTVDATVTIDWDTDAATLWERSNG